MCAVAFRTTHGQNTTRKCYTEVFVSVAILNGVVGSLSLLIRFLLIGTERYDILYTLLQNEYTLPKF